MRSQEVEAVFLSIYDREGPLDVVFDQDVWWVTVVLTTETFVGVEVQWPDGTETLGFLEV